ncbi:MAG TPA: PH domain-containing protein [Candidatus Saccharimonadales bacterium]|nr:PH domain-containing protein [Candidatus Saccharimonadales bacterium]
MEIERLMKHDEKIVRIIGRHWISVVPLMTGWAIAIITVLVGFYYLGRYGDNGLAVVPGIVALTAALILFLIFAYVTYWVFRQNKLIITSKNLIQITQNSLFSRQVSEFSMERLQDVEASSNGFFQSTLDYGQVTIETAGEEKNFVFKWAPHPRDVVALILEIADKNEQERI